MSRMTVFLDPEYDRVSELTAPYLVFDREKGKFIISEDAPKEIHEAYKRKLELRKKYKEE